MSEPAAPPPSSPFAVLSCLSGIGSLVIPLVGWLATPILDWFFFNGFDVRAAFAFGALLSVLAVGLGVAAIVRTNVERAWAIAGIVLGIVFYGIASALFAAGVLATVLALGMA